MFAVDCTWQWNNISIIKQVWEHCTSFVKSDSKKFCVPIIFVHSQKSDRKMNNKLTEIRKSRWYMFWISFRGCQCWLYFFCSISMSSHQKYWNFWSLCRTFHATKCPLDFSLMAVAITSGPAASVEIFLWCAIARGNLTCHAGKYYFSTSMMCPLFGCFTHKYRLVSTQQWTLSCLAGINKLSVHWSWRQERCTPSVQK